MDHFIHRQHRFKSLYWYATTEKDRCTHINPKGFTHLLSFLLHFWTEAVSLFLFINTYLEQCSNVRNFRERQQHNIVIVIHSLHMVEVDQKVQNKILSRYFINAEAFFPFSDSYEHVCYPRALISLLNYECLNDTLYLSETPTSYYDIRDFWRKTRD